MRPNRRMVFAALAVSASFAAGLTATAAPRKSSASTNPPNAIRIGMMKSMFRDVPSGLFAALTGPFNRILEKTIGRPGKVTQIAEAETLAQQLAAGELDLGVIHGFEFAYIRSRHADLRPLVVAVNGQPRLSASVLVRKDSSIDSFDDLAGKTVLVAKGTKEHARLFLERGCLKHGINASAWLNPQAMPTSLVEALDAVVDGHADAAVVDGVALNGYKKYKPERYQQLKMAIQSIAFPATVIVYHRGQLSEATVRQCKQGLLNADKTSEGRNMMMFWGITGFQNIPNDYDHVLKACAKYYPALSESPAE